MKILMNDLIAIFTRRPHGPVILKTGLSEEEKAALTPVRTISIGRISSLKALEKEVIREAREHNAAGYLITDLKQARFVHARATLYA